jgi:hypothetical protein
VRPDGRPHVRPLGALWSDGVLFFNAGAGTRKAINLAQNPHCVLSVATREFDLIFEGTAARVTDPVKAERIAALYRAQGWEATVAEGTASLTAPYSAPTAGPPPWDVYQFTPETVYAMGTAEPYGATRFNF